MEFLYGVGFLAFAALLFSPIGVGFSIVAGIVFTLWHYSKDLMIRLVGQDAPIFFGVGIVLLIMIIYSYVDSNINAKDKEILTTNENVKKTKVWYQSNNQEDSNKYEIMYKNMKEHKAGKLNKESK